MDTRQLRIKTPTEEIFDPLGPLQGRFDEEPEGHEILVDYDNGREYIGTADYIVFVVSTGEVLQRIPAEELRNLTEPGVQRRITQAFAAAQSEKASFLAEFLVAEAKQAVEAEKAAKGKG